MNVLLLGAGQTGSALVQRLANESEIRLSVVDLSAKRLKLLHQRFDLQTVCGHAADPDALREAGAERAEMVIAATSEDEVNMLACRMCHSLFKVPTKVARIRSERYLKNQEVLFAEGGIPVDCVISPERLVTEHIARLVRYAGARRVIELSHPQIYLLVVRANADGPEIGSPITALTASLRNEQAAPLALRRDGELLEMNDENLIQDGDEVLFASHASSLRKVIQTLRGGDKAIRSVIIAGGGRIGSALASRLESNYHVKVIEANESRARMLAEQLPGCLVLLGDAGDREILEECEAKSADVYISVTNEDEDNIMSALVAKSMGVQRTMSLVQRQAYTELLRGGTDIDVPISPQEVTASAVLRFISRSRFAGVYELWDGAQTVIEGTISNNDASSELIGKLLCNVELPQGISVVGIIRNDELVFGEALIEEGDTFLFMFQEPQLRKNLEKVFGYKQGSRLNDR